MWKETQKKLKGAYVDFKTGHGRKYPPKRVILKEIVTTREESGEQNLAYLVTENSL